MLAALQVGLFAAKRRGGGLDLAAIRGAVGSGVEGVVHGIAPAALVLLVVLAEGVEGLHAGGGGGADQIARIGTADSHSFEAAIEAHIEPLPLALGILGFSKVRGKGIFGDIGACLGLRKRRWTAG